MAVAVGQPVPVVTFAIPDQIQIVRFIAEEDAVYASVHYLAITGSQAPERKSALVCWKPDGRMRWQRDLPEAFQFACAGKILALIYDDGTLAAARGLLTIDADTGRTLTETQLDGRAAALQYYPREHVLACIIYPQHRMETLEGAWMEVRAYTRQGHESWRRRFETTELTPCVMDGRLLVLSDAHATLLRLDPATGLLRWRQPYRAATSPSTRLPTYQTCGMLSMAPTRTVAVAFDADTGVIASHFPVDLPISQYQHALATPDHLYLAITLTEGKGVLLKSFALPGGQLAWMDEWDANTDVVTPPVCWENRVAILARQWHDVIGGRMIGMTELRLYARDGTPLVRQTRDTSRQGYWDDTVAMQVAAHRLYLVDGRQLVALAWRTDTK